MNRIDKFRSQQAATVACCELNCKSKDSDTWFPKCPRIFFMEVLGLPATDQARFQFAADSVKGFFQPFLTG